MARFEIKSKDGLSVRFKGAPKYNGIFGKPSYIEFAEIASPAPIAWEVGDYVDYDRTGLRYKLYSIPQVVKSATRDKAGDSFVYKNVQFFCATKDLEIALFRDLVEYDNTIHFSSVPNVDTYEDVYGIADRIQANMDDFAPNAWSIEVFDTNDATVLAELETVRQFSVSDGTCLDALNQIYSLWKGIGWIYSYVDNKHTITIGRPNVQDSGNTTSEFSYGHGNGLKVITRAVSSKNEMATRIYAYGSERNMPTRYYNNITPAIKDAASVYIPHLMLPLSDWGSTGGLKDARLAYLEDATAITKYGLIPKVLRFDGGNGLEDIYPSIEGMTVGDVADASFPSTGWSSSDRIDEVYSAVNPGDDGQYTEGSEKLKQTVTKSITDPNKTYTTVSGQEALTVGNDAELFTTGATSMQSGKYTINMGGLGGSIVATNGDFTEVPKGFLEVYVGSYLETSKELDVRFGFTRMENEYIFSVPNVSFTTEHSGVVKAYIRFEAKIPKSAPNMSLAYHLGATTATINVEYSIPSTFTLKVPQLGFDLNTVGTSTDGLATLSMKTGMCAGRDFVVKKAEYNTTTHTWDLTCQRQDDTSLMLYFPNNVYEIASGDRYVLLDIQLPDKYVTAAMTRLHNAASDALARLCKPRMVYTPEVDSKEVFMSEISLIEGLYMPVYDTDLISATGNTEWVLIDSVTIAENEDAIPIWSVTLRDEKAESMMAALTGELADAKKRLRDWDVDEKRRPASSDESPVLIPTVVGVQIQAEKSFFPYTGDSTPQTIVLTAVTQGINNPSYQWYYLGQSGWVAISGATAQAYSVQSNSQIYYQGGEVVEDFRVVVTDGSSSWEDRVQITKLTGSTTIALSNPVHLFAGEVSSAVDDQSDSTTIVAYAGDTLVVATVNSISGAVTGMTALVRSGTNGTTAPIIDISVTDLLVEPSGALIINVTAGGVTRNLTYSWAIAFKGEGSGSAGLSNAIVYLYKRSATAPTIDWQNTLTYSFVNKALTSVPSGWSQTIPAHTADPLYVTAATASSRTDTDDIEYNEWASPVMLAEDGADGGPGANGLNSATVFLYRRYPSEPSKPSGSYTYTFATGLLSSLPSGWSQTIPSGTEPCWVSQGTAISTEATDIVSEWSNVVLFVENGTDGSNGDSIEVQWSVNGTSNWHSTYTDGDKYMRQRIGNGQWSGAIKVVGENGGSGQSSFKSIIFKRSNNTVTAPSGGSYASPLPSPLNDWSDGVPSGDAQLWMSTRIFTSDGQSPQQSSWTTPQPVTDTADIDFEFSAVETNPGNPTSNPSNWHNTATENDIWMAIRKCSNGVWGSWEISKIKGENGSNGDTIYTTFVFKSSTTKPSRPTGTNPDVSSQGWYDSPPEASESTLSVTYDSNFNTSSTPHIVSVANNGTKWGKVTFSANKGDKVKVEIESSSEHNYDFGYLSLLDDDSLLEGNVATPASNKYTAKVSGTFASYPTDAKKTVTFEIPSTGTHFFCVGYHKDGTNTSGNDTIYIDSVKIVPFIPIWMSSSLVTNGVSDGNWSDPVKITPEDGNDGRDGESHATIYMYRRIDSGLPTSYTIGNATYDFENDTLTANSGQSLNGWERDPSNLTGNGPIYVTMANAISRTNTASIAGGWNTGLGDWTPPVRWTGNDGLMGKVMRGVNEFSQYGLGTSSNPINYQGRTDVDPSHIYYDVVLYNGTLYYCEHEKNSAGTQYARQVTPGTDSYVWVVAQNFDFIATNLLLAQNAFIDVLSGNGIYMYGNYGSADGQVVAGMQGGSRTLYNGSYVSQINFFAGGSEPQTAPFRVDYEGNVFMSSGTVGPFTLDQYGLTASRTEVVSGNTQTHYVRYGQDSVSYSYSALGRTHEIDINPAIGIEIDSAIIGLSVAGGGDIQRSGESVVTSYDGDILRVRKMTQTAYNNLATKDSKTLYVITS